MTCGACFLPVITPYKTQGKWVSWNISHPTLRRRSFTTMKDIIRDSTVGQLINIISRGHYLPYADQRPDYDIPSHFLLPPTAAKLASVDNGRGVLSPESTIAVASSPHGSGELLTRINTPATEGLRHDREKGEVKNEPLRFDPYLVGWNGDDDPENPRCVYTLFLGNLSQFSCGSP
jgi:hypothetical protein